MPVFSPAFFCQVKSMWISTERSFTQKAQRTAVEIRSHGSGYPPFFPAPFDNFFRRKSSQQPAPLQNVRESTHCTSL
jgi:hypothetical protein